jgi:hypothetical protein
MILSTPIFFPIVSGYIYRETPLLGRREKKRRKRKI